MRTTLTLDGDVAVKIERLRRERDASLKDIVNGALRLGLNEMTAPTKKRKVFRTRVIRGVTPLFDNVDNVAEVIAYLDSDEPK